MRKLDITTPIAILGAGAMGGGIAQLAASSGHSVVLFDSNPEQIMRAQSAIDKTLKRQVEKGQIDEAKARSILKRIILAEDVDAVRECGLVIEAIIESLKAKQDLFSRVENLVSTDTILATNTSSLSIASIASACRNPGRLVGIHFFNPAPVMPLVEIIPGILTDADVSDAARGLIDRWGKTTVLAKDTPGFIVNRIARPFYSESIRQLEEGVADAPTIDWAMRERGFRMGPFELMDFIGNDVNYKVTEIVFESFFYDPRFKPSLTQKRLVEARLFGRKSGRGYYDYSAGVPAPEPNKDSKLCEAISSRVLAMLINEAADALFMGVASKIDIETAMTKGVNYPKGLLHWADELGIENVLAQLEALHQEYGEDRYRPNPLLRRMAKAGQSFF
ncbi:MAG: NAD(P)-binding domain-containing protein [Oligoflexia bacterium]|nr:NAD(P)-binding domain-containing protein [Oligoflexia bacterium]